MGNNMRQREGKRGKREKILRSRTKSDGDGEEEWKETENEVEGVKIEGDGE